MTGLRSGPPARDGIVHSPYVIPLPNPDLTLSGELPLTLLLGARMKLRGIDS